MYNAHVYNTYMHVCCATFRPTPAVGNAPHQPLSFKFRWSWLHYSEESDTALFNCVNAYSEGKLQSVGGIESTYISKGYNN